MASSKAAWVFAFEQYVAAGNQCGENVVDHAALADHDFLQLVAYRLGQLAGAQALLLGMARCAGLDLFTRHDLRSAGDCHLWFIFHKSVTYLIWFFHFLTCITCDWLPICKIASPE